MNYEGIIIEESLTDSAVLRDVKILKKEVEKVTSKHKTPWIKQWTMYTIEMTEEQAEQVAKKISQSIDIKHGSWYADYKNDNYHYIIFPNIVFKVDRNKPQQYQAATDYGISLGIPEYQVDFAPDAKVWER